MGAFNGVGQFIRSYLWANDAANNVNITASRMDTEDNGFAQGLSNCVTRDGQSPPTANLPMGGFKLTNLADGSSDGDSINYGQFTSQDAASLIGFIQTGSGAVIRNVEDKLRDTVSVLDFGADPTGILDCTTSINNAVASLPNGGLIYFPPGVYKVTGTISIGYTGITLRGDSRWSSKIVFANGASDCIVTSAPNLYGIGLEHLLLDHSGKTGGRSLFIDRGNQINLDYVFFNNCWTGLDIYATNTVHLNQVNVQGVLGGAGAYGLRWRAPSDGSLRSDVLSLQDFVCNCFYSGADGVVWDGFCATMNVQTATVIHARYGWLIKNSTPSASYFPSFLLADNIIVDGASAGAMRIEAGRSFRISNADLMNASGSAGQGSADDYGVQILDDASYSIVSDIHIINSRMGTSKKSAFYSAARDVTLVGNTMLTGGTTPAGTYPAIDIVTPAQDVMIANNKMTDWGSALTWKYGIRVGAATARVNVGPNLLYGATDRAVSWSNTDTGSICHDINTDNPSRPVSTGITITGNRTLSGVEALSPSLLLGGTAGAFNLTTATAAQIVAACQSPYYFASIPVTFINATNGVATMVAGSGVTLAGNVMTIPSATQRQFTIVLANATPGSEAVTVYG